jgi:hypothetical protein
VLTGLLFLHRISDNRMTGTARRNTHVFEMLCGAGGLRNVILVTTMWDSVDEQAGLLREKELRLNFWQSMSRSGSRMARFDNTHQSAWSILDQFTGFRRPLQLQVEMVDQGKSLVRTAAGMALLQWLDQLISQFRDTIAAIRQRLRSIPKGSDIAEELLLDQLTAQSNINGASAQKRSLSRKRKAEKTADPVSLINEGKVVEEVATKAHMNAELKEREERSCDDKEERIPDIAAITRANDASQKVPDYKTALGNGTMAEDIPGSWKFFANPDKSSHYTDFTRFADMARASFAIIELWGKQQRFVC